ncbi:protein of unknown function [Shewanella benthica]|uniref:Uncharacterized protein n=1 Tax=Shewanella benthica TaxID=43661 RepID=A0A330M5B7_9GAMM|nr:protein of unknown function [Shewanella benthica]
MHGAYIRRTKSEGAFQWPGFEQALRVQTQHQTTFDKRKDFTLLDPRSGHMGAKKQYFGCAAFNCFVARSDAVAELGTSHMDVVNVRNAWMQFLTKLSGGATSGVGIHAFLSG